MTAAMEKERADFERLMRSEAFMWSDEELQWQSERNCYKHYWMHLMWRIWIARSLASPQVPVEAIKAAIEALNEDIDGTSEYIANSDYDDNSAFEGFNAERKKHIESLKALLPEEKA